jgi:glycosyltransferase involved in cell wall biosynthesis
MMSNFTSNTKISVVMSVFNDEKNLTTSVESILNQSFKNFEFLIMDDCSTDSSFKILNTFQDSRIKLFKNKENIGLTKSLNKLIKSASGNIIARQDSDDVSIENRFEKQLDFLFKNKLDFCTSRAFVKGTKKSIPRYSYLFPINQIIKYKNPFIHGTLFIYRSVLESVGLYNEDYKYAQDYKLFLDLINKGIKFQIMPDRLYILNTVNNISVNHADEQKFYFEKAKKEL